MGRRIVATTRREDHSWSQNVADSEGKVNFLNKGMC